MSYPNAYLPTATTAALLQDLKFRLPSLSLQAVQSADSNGWPVLTINPTSNASWVSGQTYAVIRIQTVTTPMTDVFGNTDLVVAPMLVQLCVEGNTTAAGALPATSNANDVLPFAVELAILGELLQIGSNVQVYNSQAGVEPTTSLMIAANLVASFQSLQYPLTGAR